MEPAVPVEPGRLGLSVGPPGNAHGAFQRLLSAVESESRAGGGGMARPSPSCLSSGPGGAFVPISASAASSSCQPALTADKGTQQGPGAISGGFQAPISLLHAAAPASSAFSRHLPATLPPPSVMGHHHHHPLHAPSFGAGFAPDPAWAAAPVAAAPGTLGPSGLPLSMHRAIFAAPPHPSSSAFVAAPTAAAAVAAAAAPITAPLPVPALSAADMLRAKAAPTPSGAGGGSSNVVGLLPGVPLELSQDRCDGPKPKRAARANLNAFTAEQKQERRKERARVYSAIARERQEAQMKELKLRVESLTVYKLMIDESPDMVCVISPDRDARILFANEACGRMIQREPADLVSRPLWEILHPEDKETFLSSFSETILSREGIGKVQCRVRSSSGPDDAASSPSPDASYMAVGISMRKGTQGVISIMRPLNSAQARTELAEDGSHSNSRSSSRSSNSSSHSSGGSSSTSSEAGVRASSREE